MASFLASERWDHLRPGILKYIFYTKIFYQETVASLFNDGQRSQGLRVVYRCLKQTGVIISGNSSIPSCLGNRIVLNDVLQPGLKLVFCGTAAGTESARRGAYYAGRGNKFWRILHKTGLTPRQLAPEEYVLLRQFGIGLTDLVKGKAGMDHTLAREDYDRELFDRQILEAQPEIACFNGKQAAMVYLKVKEVEFGFQGGLQIGNTKLFVAPSTSGAAGGFWDETHWHNLAKHVMATGYVK